MEDGDSAEAFRAFAAGVALQREDPSPLWVQLKNRIEHAILDGTLPENARLPSEQAMCSMFDLSRPVIRNALQALAGEGRVIKQPRKGMFVAPRAPELAFMTSALGVFDDLSAKGYKVTVKTYEFGLHPANEDERRVFKLPEGFQVIRALRVYHANETPLTHTLISLPAHRLPGFEKLDMEGRSIFGTIRELYGLTVARADRWLKGAIVPPEVAARMGVPPGGAMIAIESVAYDHDGNALEYYRAYYNSEVAPIHVATDAH
ncbi:UTRA domain-containing protein [Rhodobacter sphaeroides]|jgi:GntR family transcriptional regulator|uniref:Transcriptional regulator, GntR family n=2 Tax=Cereibacter sphaeroides TaxID=1063 RepID=Q3J3W3_CERS4|nr:GntR family transcriptional regulator [Cereibacter sphaeroides]ABA78521.1 transcriptional regulator, GntR family [Cereibacter sphaeroides 2.4.1]AMJ46872.1 GntR family transcriptional regulator [Cereibacter sphaeroides]ANS33584.1 GntR family transcriptional regulator [Cereibacter sphaeroides]ATN62628.1 GntR family transcriptional regulator [Cereibacter sphaeroides]AXC60741.1 GntR family transcriptional regulator [Cereibacter sphaeroides 2.4.1]